MDDLYDNLENYNDVNIVDELKCENKELKLKLEEISKAMAQLQKDFDKVNSEYKKLEINYSSLLKTARAEIERKTETIKNLNFEKDMIVINALKETGKNVLKRKKFNNKEKEAKNNKTSNSDVNKEKSNIKAAPESNHHINDGHGPSVDSSSTISTGNKSTSSEEKVTKPIESCEQPKNKEKISKDNHKDDTLQSSKNIINRRKSVLGLCIQEAKFSSDEDVEAKHAASRVSPVRSDLKHHKWHDTRDYRVEPQESYESSKDHSRLRTSRYTNYEKSRNVDRRESFQKHRRQYSPQRDQHRYINEHAEDYNSRGDYGKQRVSRTNSPSTDKYNRSKSRDRKLNHDRDNYREYNRHPNRYHEHNALKRRTRNEFDEPCSKRQKIDLHSKGAAETNSYVNNKEREITERIHVSRSQYKQNSSCQSPDYVNVDSQHYVKEVMSTAESKFEDPRISSKKYILKTSNDSTILSTVVGRNVEMQCVDKSLWKFEKPDVPAALSKPISDQENDDLLKEIYMDIQNPELHQSLESSEIQDLNDDLTTNYSKEIDKNHDNIRDGKSIGNTNDSETRNLNVSKEKVVDTKAFEKSLKKFKIPKIKKPDKMDKAKDLAHQEPCDISKKSYMNLDINVENHQHLQNIEYMSDKQTNKKNKSKHDIKNNSESDKSIIDKRTQEPCDVSEKIYMHLDTNVENHQHIQISDTLNNIRNKSKHDIEDNSESDKAISDKITQEIIRTIEGDLELSDEASDIVEFHNDTNKITNESSQEPKITLNIDKNSNSPIITENNLDVSSFKSEPTKSDKVKSLTKDSSKESKKRKSKRKSFEQKEIHSVTSDQQNDKSHNTKKIKEKEIKQTVSKQTKSKFSDLFGDSSSLITPDDLGLNNIQVQPVDKYTSIFDNTQDAVDLSGEDIVKTLTSVDKVNAFDTVLDKLNDEKVSDTIKNNFGVNVTVVYEDGENRTEDKTINNVYENTKSETLTDVPNVVKTVIISSGIQPECVSESGEPLVNNPQIVAPSLGAITDHASSIKCPLNSIKALATSTPQKCIEHVDVPALLRDSLDINTNLPTEDISASSNMSNSNINNTDAPQNEADIPDVRIFVRRRRKPVRKAT